MNACELNVTRRELLLGSVSLAAATARGVERLVRKASEALCRALGVALIGVTLNLLPIGNVYAQEAPGRRFQEVVEDINSTLRDARQKTAEIDRKESQQTTKPTKEKLAERAQAQRDMEEADGEFSENPTPENEEALHGAIIRYARNSTDILDRTKEDILLDEERLGILIPAIAKCINRLLELRAISASMGSAGTPANRERLAAEKQEMANLAHLTNFLKELPSANTPQLKQVLATLNGQARLLLQQKDGGPFNLAQKLEVQRSAYEFVLAQLQDAKQGLTNQKLLLAQIAQGEVARHLLMQASALLRGNLTLLDAPKIVLERQKERDDVLGLYIKQNDNLDRRTQGSSNSSSDPGTSYLDQIMQEEGM